MRGKITYQISNSGPRLDIGLKKILSAGDGINRTSAGIKFPKLRKSVNRLLIVSVLSSVVLLALGSTRAEHILQMGFSQREALEIVPGDFTPAFENNLQLPEINYAEPPSSLDLIEGILVNPPSLKSADHGDGGKGLKANGNLAKAAAVTAQLKRKPIKEKVDTSYPEEPQIVYNSVQSPQFSDPNERNPFDVETPESLFN